MSTWTLPPLRMMQPMKSEPMAEPPTAAPAMTTNKPTAPIVAGLPPRPSTIDDRSTQSPGESDSDDDGSDRPTSRGRPPLSGAKESSRSEREGRLAKDRQRKTKYRKEKLAQLNELKSTASALELQLEQLVKQKHDKMTSKRFHPAMTANGRPSVWKDIAEAEVGNVQESIKLQETLFHSLEQQLEQAIELKRKLGDRNDAPLCFDPRRRPDVYLPMNSLGQHPSLRLQSIHSMLDQQYHHMHDGLMSKLPTADNEGPYGLVLLPSRISFLEMKKFGVVYGHANDVAEVVWRLRLSGGPGAKVEMLDEHTCFIQVVDKTSRQHFISKRYIEHGRVVILFRSVLYDELFPDQNGTKDHIISWFLVEDISHGRDTYATSSIRSYTQVCLNALSTASAHDYNVYMKEATKHNDLLNDELHRHFRCLILS
ncbi:Aste57867_21113 [Aphanomyces stellatus]|uniref:Aste57867_21113 protein n=1 Tax=Aphanomyces stellatus TaxID=120398 RepID=A0A485LHX8_9STRA|nr:hypothetical protein As57867_021045 [Aphanomyces stellatus]VFT97787.1 Aste57867_21113 [Aphanomyces stellatus]